MPQMVPPCQNRSPEPSAAEYVVVDGPPGPIRMAAIDGPPGPTVAP